MNKRAKGFTIVELLVVITVVVALASLVVFGFSSWRTRVAKTEVRNEVINGAAAAKNYATFNNALPADQTAFNVVYAPGSAVTLTYIRRADGLSFCLNGTSGAVSTVRWSIDTAVNYQPVTGTCA